MLNDNTFARISEARIQEAMKRGEFDNLPGRGKRLQIESLSHIPKEERAAYIVMKNAGLIPQEVELMKEIAELRQKVDSCKTDSEKNKLVNALKEKELRLSVVFERRRRR